MKTQTPHAFYKLGASLRYLFDAKHGWRIKADGAIYSNIGSVIKSVDELQLSVAQCALTKLRSLTEEFRSCGADDVLSTSQATAVRSAARAFREVVKAELKSLVVFAITPKRFPTERLLGDMAFLFPNGCYAQLSSIAQYDIGEAGKCIAFERPTAAAFHILRAVEETLKDFYLHAIKQNRTTQLTMGPIIADLRVKRKTMHLKDLTSCLDNIRNSYRNPTQHPEKVYDMDEVQNLLGLGLDAISKLIRARREI